MKKQWKNYHLQSEEQGKTLCGRKRVVIVSQEKWDGANELMKCKKCNNILNNNRNN